MVKPPLIMIQSKNSHLAIGRYIAQQERASDRRLSLALRVRRIISKLDRFPNDPKIELVGRIRGELERISEKIVCSKIGCDMNIDLVYQFQGRIIERVTEIRSKQKLENIEDLRFLDFLFWGEESSIPEVLKYLFPNEEMSDYSVPNKIHAQVIQIARQIINLEGVEIASLAKKSSRALTESGLRGQDLAFLRKWKELY